MQSTSSLADLLSFSCCSLVVSIANNPFKMSAATIQHQKRSEMEFNSAFQHKSAHSPIIRAAKPNFEVRANHRPNNGERKAHRRAMMYEGTLPSKR
jgi:hypothetical protein